MSILAPLSTPRVSLIGLRGVEITTLMEQLAAFARERDWEQFHTPKNLLLALVDDVGELAESGADTNSLHAVLHLKGRTKDQ